MIIRAKVHNRAKFAKIIKNDEVDIEIWVREPAIDNKANSAVIAAVSKHFKVKKSEVKIVRGKKSKHKILEI